jgi:amidohydrolase
MQRRSLLLAVTSLSACLVAAAPHAAQPDLDALIAPQLPALLDTYRTLHANPELSHYEVKTAAFLAGELRQLGFTVTEGIGKFQRPEWKGHGIAAVLRNGTGPTVLVRTDMDALPVEEKTGLPYASKVRATNDVGQEVGVMHACGHDIHMSAFLGTARLLVQLKNEWQGTLVMIGQPAEETIDGARAMLEDGLYEKIPKIDYALALHDNGDFEAGKVGIVPGYAMASATSVDISVRGAGGHGSRPELAKDPVVLASQIVIALQTIVSRENSPLDPAVVTVGSIHGGTRYNIIPDEVKLQLTVRTYKEETRQRILAAIERIARNTALAAGMPEALAPVVKVSESEVTPSQYNSPELTERLSGALRSAIGADNVITVAPVMASEDFGRFALEGNQIPATMFWLGAMDPAKIAEGKRTGVPYSVALHSPFFAPLPEPTIRTGVKAMTAAVLDLLAK